jgi:hypothetical protein
MPAASTAELRDPVPFPAEIGEPVWRERRAFPVAAAYGVPAVFLVALAFGVRTPALHAVFAVAAFAMAVLLVRARRRALIETYTLSERYVAIEQPAGGRVAIPIHTLTRVTLEGDAVRLESTLGVVTLGFVGRRRTLLRALDRLVPGVPVERDMTAFCPT